MKNTVKIFKNISTKNEVGEIVNTQELFLSIKAEVQFERVQESGSKFDAGWSNKLIVRTRYSKSLMPLITSRDGFSMTFQGTEYKIMNYEMWNQTQKYITFYIQKV
ncbi:phage head completion protein [Aeromonas sp. AE23HZ002T15]